MTIEKYTYILVFQDDSGVIGPAKIGITENLPRRISELQRTNKKTVNRRRSSFLYGNFERLLLNANQEYRIGTFPSEYSELPAVKIARQTARLNGAPPQRLDSYFKALRLDKEALAMEKYRKKLAQQKSIEQVALKWRLSAINR